MTINIRILLASILVPFLNPVTSAENETLAEPIAARLPELDRLPWSKGRAFIPAGKAISFPVGRHAAASEIVSRSTLVPEGKTFQTDESGFLQISFFNRLTLGCGPDSQFSVNTFQTKVVDNVLLEDPGYEPSRSRLELTLEKGKFAIIRATPSPRSTTVVHLGPATIETLATRFYVDAQGAESQIWMIEGHASMQLEGTRGYIPIAESTTVELAAFSVQDYDAMHPFAWEEVRPLRQLLQQTYRGFETTRFYTDTNGELAARVLIPKEHFNLKPYNNRRFRH